MKIAKGEPLTAITLRIIPMGTPGREASAAGLLTKDRWVLKDRLKACHRPDGGCVVCEQCNVPGNQAAAMEMACMRAGSIKPGGCLHIWLPARAEFSTTDPSDRLQCWRACMQVRGDKDPKQCPHKPGQFQPHVEPE